MGLTLVAVVVTALLLPGFIAARAFYQAAQTKEVEPAVPPMSSVDGITLIGIFTVFVHFLYISILLCLRDRYSLGWIDDIKAANPYVSMLSSPTSVDAIYSLIFRLFVLCILALMLGTIAGRLMLRFGESSIFYGPMAEMFAKTGSDQDFIIADVLTKIQQEGALFGYQGTVASLLRDADRFPAKVVLKDASVTRVVMAEGRPLRREVGETIDWIALSADQWQNIAFKVFKVDNEEGNMGDGEAIDAGRAG